ncbi:MAG: hypothetical protein BWY31_02070 [Lentisphaerae bacterium ADurb.Bin242]|nr:MAG: hypothetical protein BWY31_02070 [Lentisphaerae bacterium ADurb.Bin242]
MMIVINEDNDNFFKYPTECMTEESLCRYIDFYADTKTTHFFMCPSGQRTSYRSAVQEAIWDPQPDGKPSGNIWARNCLCLFNQSIDPYHVWISRCRKRGLSPWISTRMNDIHFGDDFHYFRHTNFWREHPELHRAAPETSKSWEDYAYDYSKPGAFRYYLDLVIEQIDRYDADGYELDWMRWPACLSPGKERAQTSVLTDFMAQVRTRIDKAAERRGHPVGLSVRVPADPEAALERGFDIAAWTGRKLVDMVAASPFYASNDPELSFGGWKEFLGAAMDHVILLPVIDNGSSPGAGLDRIEHTAPVLRGWADTMLEDGFEGLYFFNYPYLLKNENLKPALPRDSVHAFLKDGLAKEKIRAGERRCIVSFRDVPNRKTGSLSQLPAGLPATLAIRNGKAPVSGSLRIELGLRRKNAVPFWFGGNSGETIRQVRLNGNACPFEFDSDGMSCIVRPELRFFKDKRNVVEVEGADQIEVVQAELIIEDN